MRSRSQWVPRGRGVMEPRAGCLLTFQISGKVKSGDRDSSCASPDGEARGRYTPPGVVR